LRASLDPETPPSFLDELTCATVAAEVARAGVKAGLLEAGPREVHPTLALDPREKTPDVKDVTDLSG
jgi:hypothetical protein